MVRPGLALPEAPTEATIGSMWRDLELCRCGRAGREATGEVVKLGLAFMLIFTAFQTGSFFQTPVLKDLGFGESLGFAGLGVLYATMSVSIFAAPHLIKTVGARKALCGGACLYCVFIISMVRPVAPVFVMASALNGLGAAALWTSQGSLLTVYSTDATRGRNAGIFWGFLQASLLIGSITAFSIVPAGAEVTAETAQKLYIALSVVVVAGTAVLFTLREPAGGDRATGAVEDREQRADLLAHDSPGHDERLGVVPVPDSSTGGGARSCGEWCSQLLPGMVNALKLLGNRDLQRVCLLVVFSGFQLTFWQGKYPLVISGRDDDVPLPPEFEPRLISGLLVSAGVAESLGGFFCGRLADRVGNSPVVIAGVVGSVVAYVLTWMNLLSGWWAPSVGLSYVVLFVIGVGDAIVNTLVYALLGRLYTGGDSAVFCIYFFSKSISAGCAFLYGDRIPLAAQLCILIVAGIVGTWGFVSVDRGTRPSSAE